MMTKFVFIAVLCLGLSACGQKGALYLPEKPNKSSVHQPQGMNEQDDFTQADLTEENLQENPNDY